MALSIEKLIIGLPKNFFIFLNIILFDPDLAGIIANLLIFLVISLSRLISVWASWTFISDLIFLIFEIFEKTLSNS